MNEYKNPPLKSLIAPTCSAFTMASSSDDGRVTESLTEGVSRSAEGDSAIDEDASTAELAPKFRVFPNLTVAVREVEECIREFLDQLSGKEGALSREDGGSEAADDDNFVDIMSGYQPAAIPRNDDFVVPRNSGTELEVGNATSCEEGADVTMTTSMDPESRMG